MKKNKKTFYVLAISLNLCPALCAVRNFSIQSITQLSCEKLEKIGNIIWKNECGKSVEKLTWWNQGEEFASLGIGHFIWYPQGTAKTYTETFPTLLEFLVHHGKKLPSWLGQTMFCPWKNREQFFAEKNSQRMGELRQFLASTIQLQAQFILNRASQSLVAMLNAVTETQKRHIEKQLYRLAASENGVFAIIDYINFKGEGTNQKEQYNGLGWGLLHILQAMNGQKLGDVAVKEFSLHAKKILADRVINAPKEKDEKKFLEGWLKRIDSYIQA